jgi:DNA adenine methylase
MPHIPYRKKYIEVFGGTGAVLLNRERSEVEVFNDRNSGIVDFYKCIRDPAGIEQVKKRLDLMQLSRQEFIEARDNWASCSDIVDRATQWYYSIEASFSGMGKAFGRAINTPNKDVTEKFPYFDHVHKRLKNVLIENIDAFDLIKDFDCHDAVFYLDPPYMPGMSFEDKYEETLTQNDHVRLCELIMKSKGFFALSGYNNELYDSYHWDKIIDYKILITADAQAKTETNNKKGLESSRGMRKEFLWIKEAAL